MVLLYVKVHLRLSALPSAVSRLGSAAPRALVAPESHQASAGLGPVESRPGAFAGWTAAAPEPSGRWW